VTLSHDALIRTLNSRFVCGFKNIKDEPYCGKSGQHDPDTPAVLTSNGAGPHNVQIFVLSGDGTVLHCLPGFWTPDDLLTELQFAQSLNRVWKDPHLSRAAKDKRFTEANRKHAQVHPLAMRARSQLQGFDEKKERTKADSDFKVQAGQQPTVTLTRRGLKLSDMKTVDQVVHERMAQRPFVPYEEFDVAAYVDYGQLRYDKHENDPRRGGKGKQATRGRVPGTSPDGRVRWSALSGDHPGILLFLAACAVSHWA
jgi:hypothetical protein